MKITLCSVIVNDRARALKLSTEVLGVPATSFESTDVHREHERLVAQGVAFRTPPTPMGPVTVAVFDDTCRNLTQLHQAGTARK